MKQYRHCRNADMNLIIRLTNVFLVPVLFSSMFVFVQGWRFPLAVSSQNPVAFKTPTTVLSAPLETEPALPAERAVEFELVAADLQPEAPVISYAFGNPAGCAPADPGDLTGAEMLANAQSDMGDGILFLERRMHYIWNGPQNAMTNVTDDPYVFEFSVDIFEPPFTYKADAVITALLNQGFVVWFRYYDGHFRLMAVPMIPGVQNSIWANYVSSYWTPGGVPQDDRVEPVTKKLPCHWVIDRGFVSAETLRAMFDFTWSIPDYLTPGRNYLASTCEEAYRVSQEEVGYWDATSMCGPLAWTIVKDANSFPYRVGNWYASASLFTLANPRWNGRPWVGFDPETYDLISTDEPLMGYDFAAKGDLQPGDIVYSFATLYVADDGQFDHIFLVAGVDANNSRLSISNMVQNAPYADCSIREIALYTPGDRETGVINHEWNDHGYGRTGTTGFDILRWKWATYHLNGQSMPYTVRRGDTLETIAFDWKVSPQSLLEANPVTDFSQLNFGQVILLPTPGPL
jgi:hypothetical protein